MHLTCGWAWAALHMTPTFPGAAVHAALYSPSAVHCDALRYQGYDWRDRRNWGCNSMKSPVGHKFYNSTLSIYDLFFVKVKTSLIEAGDTAAQQAVTHSQ